MYEDEKGFTGTTVLSLEGAYNYPGGRMSKKRGVPIVVPYMYRHLTPPGQIKNRKYGIGRWGVHVAITYKNQIVFPIQELMGIDVSSIVQHCLELVTENACVSHVVKNHCQ